MITNDFEKLSLKKFKIKSILPDATILCLGKRRCLAKGTVVCMYGGTLRKVEDIMVGEQVMGDDDTPRTVLETANGIDRMYKISHDNGDNYTVNSEHVLCLKNMEDDTFIDMPLKEYTVLDDAQKKILHGYQKVKGEIHTSPLEIEYVGVDEFYGFLLDGNHRFMLGNGILTHNSGKSHGKGTEILMYDGSLRKVEDINVGEQVMGDDSTPRTVLETHSGTDKLYKVTNNRGDSYVVNSHHILSLVNIHDGQIVDMELMDYLQLPETAQRQLLGYQVPIEFPHKEVPHDPYIIGCKGDLNNLYKCNSRDVRLAVLAGLIDTRGHSENNKFVITVTETQKPTQRNNIIYLVRSLGFVTTSETLVFGVGDIINTRTTIKIGGHHLERIPTKVVKYITQGDKALREDTDRVSLLCPISIEEIGEGDYYGIELDGNNRYVLGNFIVTHNSWLVRDIFYHHRHIPSGVVFSGTEEASPFFSDFIPDCFIHSEYDPELIESIMNRQRRKIREAKNSGRSDTGKMASNNVFIVLDDMLHDAQNWKKEKTIKNIFFNGRHYNFLFILTMQYPLGITPELRSNIDYVFIFNEPSVKNRRKIYEDYAGMIPSFDHFCNILDACTQNHECLVIKTSGNSTDIRDQIFWYKAESHTKFRVGHDKLWEYHDDRYNRDYECQADEDQAEMEKLKRKFAKTRKLKVIVSRQGDIVGYKDSE
jgi:hypothetical protein